MATGLKTELRKLLGKNPLGSIVDYGYNDWLEFFRTIPVAKIANAQEWLMDNLPGDGYAAASRWIDVSQNPSKIDKIVQGKLKSEHVSRIKELAKADDKEAFYEALIEHNVDKLEDEGATAQEVARLTRNIDIFHDKLAEIRSRKPKKGTVLEQTLKLTARTPKTKKKEPKK